MKIHEIDLDGIKMTVVEDERAGNDVYFVQWGATPSAYNVTTGKVILPQLYVKSVSVIKDVGTPNDEDKP